MTDPFKKLMAILDKLDELRIAYTVTRVREDAVMILAPAPGEYWEIEIMSDGSLEIEVFRSDGRIHHDEGKLKELLDCYSERAVAVSDVKSAAH
jgi:hypothetical protein